MILRVKKETLVVFCAKTQTFLHRKKKHKYCMLFYNFHILSLFCLTVGHAKIKHGRNERYLWNITIIPGRVIFRIMKQTLKFMLLSLNFHTMIKPTVKFWNVFTEPAIFKRKYHAVYLVDFSSISRKQQELVSFIFRPLTLPFVGSLLKLMILKDVRNFLFLYVHLSTLIFLRLPLRDLYVSFHLQRLLNIIYNNIKTLDNADYLSCLMWKENNNYFPPN